MRLNVIWLIVLLISPLSIIPIAATATDHAGDHADNHDGDSRSDSARCAVVTVAGMDQYFVASQRECFRNSAIADEAGFLPYGTLGHSNRGTKFSSSGFCKVVALPASGRYYLPPDYHCKSSVSKAELAGFSPFISPKSTTSPTTLLPSRQGNKFHISSHISYNQYTQHPTQSSAVTPTPTPSGQNFSFNLSPSHGHTEYSGHCDGVLNYTLDNFAFTCSHNVTTATWAHFHLLNNTIICEQQTPPSPFSLSCQVTPPQADLIQQGLALVDIHTGTGAGADQVLAGLVIPPA